jgi:glutamine cyclotransferase
VKKIKTALFLFACLSVWAACGHSNSSNEEENLNTLPPPALLGYQVIRSHPHDTGSFTQGLVMYKGELYESTGNPDNLPNNGAWIGKLDLKTGVAEKKALLSNDFFGEGITILNNKVYRLTWQNQKAMVYQYPDMKQINEFFYPGEGWGITDDGRQLIMSNGSNLLSFRNPDNFKEIKSLSVQDNSGMKNNLNELELIDGYVFANVWQTRQILKIDTASGNVTGILDLSDLIGKYAELNAPPTDVLNGIAWDSTARELYITGKKWPKIFVLKLN